MFKNLIIKLDKTLALVPLALVSIYRLVFSRFTRPTCRFYPSCSSYAVAVIKKHGFIFGVPRVIWRIFRCNPFNDGGYDPVK